MAKATKVLLLSVVCLSALSALARGETLADIIAAVEEKSRSMKDMSCDLSMAMNVMGQSISARGNMRMLLPDKFMMNLEMKMPNMDMDMTMKMVSNGQVMYQDMSVGDRRMINRVDPKAAGISMEGFGGMGGAGMGAMAMTPNPAQCLAELKETMDVKQLPDETLQDGQAAWVIEGKFKPEQLRLMEARMKGRGGENLETFKSQMAGIRLYIGKQDKYMNRMVFLSSTDEETGSMAFTNLKMNTGLTEADFAYVPPEGVQVNDMTQMMRAFQAAPGKTEAPGEPAPAGERPASAVLKVGVAGPAFTVQTLAGKKLDLVDLRGKPVALFFWATWHHGSLDQLAEMDALAKAHRAHGLEVIALSLDEPAAADEVRKAVKEKGVTISAAVGHDAIFDAYWISEIPSYVLMDAEGKVLSSESKPKDLSGLKKTLEDLFKKADEKVVKN